MKLAGGRVSSEFERELCECARYEARYSFHSRLNQSEFEEMFIKGARWAIEQSRLLGVVEEALSRHPNVRRALALARLESAERKMAAMESRLAAAERLADAARAGNLIRP